MTGFTQSLEVDKSFKDFTNDLPSFTDVMGFSIMYVIMIMLVVFVSVGIYKYYKG